MQFSHALRFRNESIYVAIEFGKETYIINSLIRCKISILLCVHEYYMIEKVHST